MEPSITRAVIWKCCGTCDCGLKGQIHRSGLFTNSFLCYRCSLNQSAAIKLSIIMFHSSLKPDLYKCWVQSFNAQGNRIDLHAKLIAENNFHLESINCFQTSCFIRHQANNSILFIFEKVNSQHFRSGLNKIMFPEDNSRLNQ